MQTVQFDLPHRRRPGAVGRAIPQALIAGLLSALAAAPTAASASLPAGAASAPPTAHGTAVPVPRHKPQVYEHLVDLNSAGRTELTTLPGIGPAEAKRIIANRPYLTKTELVTKQVMPVGPYLSIKDRVVAMQKLPPR